MRTPRPSDRASLRAFIPLSALLLSTLGPSAEGQTQQQPSPCFRWSGQACGSLFDRSRWRSLTSSVQMAIANSPGSSGNGSSSLYYYGGQAMTNWPTGTPNIRLVQEDNGNYSYPPAVARAFPALPSHPSPESPPSSHSRHRRLAHTLSPDFLALAVGALWTSANGQTLYQYGGQFSDSPTVPPPAENVFAYDIPSNSWSVVQTNGVRVGRVAEGCPAIVPAQGTDGDNVGYSTQGWSNEIARIYLNSMAKFDLGSKSWTNITSYSGDASTSNTSTPITPLNRADGTLTYVPDLGTDNKGILVSIGGATDSQYVDNSVLDVFDIGTGGWTKQSTLGDTIGAKARSHFPRTLQIADTFQRIFRWRQVLASTIAPFEEPQRSMASRRTICANLLSLPFHPAMAEPGSSRSFVYGGQQLNQSDRDSAMYILSIQQNSYTWSYVGDDLSGQPPGRAGHQCALSGNQLIVVGGLIAGDVLCEQPGSAWQSNFQAGSTFSTPALVANITGGIGTGSSTSGAGSATGGNGSSDPDTSGGTDSGSTSPSGTTGSSDHSKTDIGAIAGGIVGGVVGLALLALLLLMLMRKRRRERAVEDGHQQRDKLGTGAKPGRSDSGSSRFAFPYEKHRPHDSRSPGYTDNGVYNGVYGAVNNRDSHGLTNDPARRAVVTGPFAIAEPDDVEEETRHMEAAFSSSLVPKRELRVFNADEE
ncbi:SPOSA6832_03417 [Sporobolomyces salmonicolor]|uniref:SPOSA6832_03417-mRNA-1:cds n=1 Tax=Sporidiobolus salmonicolor TaxID=5005 RepID=A0A0D6EPG8_SPOSA|nr:SPOSA6832_03417 [Sporobolomyces salmonicolor]